MRGKSPIRQNFLWKIFRKCRENGLWLHGGAPLMRHSPLEIPDTPVGLGLTWLFGTWSPFGGARTADHVAWNDGAYAPKSLYSQTNHQGSLPTVTITVTIGPKRATYGRLPAWPISAHWAGDRTLQLERHSSQVAANLGNPESFIPAYQPLAANFSRIIT